MLWEGRYKWSPVHNEAHLLACSRYVELTPVRAGITERPESYRWSSYRQHFGQGYDFPWLDRAPAFEGLGQTGEERGLHYAELVRSAISEAGWALIREALQRGQLTRNARFIDDVAAILCRRIGHRKPGRRRPEAGK